MTYYAHSGRGDDRKDWQALKAHLEQVAALAAHMAEALGLERAAFLAGLFHDLGKYTADFQRRLAGAEVRVDHSTAGAWYMLQAVQGQDRFIGELIAYGGVDRNIDNGLNQAELQTSPPRGGVDRNACTRYSRPPPRVSGGDSANVIACLPVPAVYDPILYLLHQNGRSRIQMMG